MEKFLCDVHKLAVLKANSVQVESQADTMHWVLSKQSKEAKSNKFRSDQLQQLEDDVAALHSGLKMVMRSHM